MPAAKYATHSINSDRTTNAYVDALHEQGDTGRVTPLGQIVSDGLYYAIPKPVWAAIAISALTCGGDQLDEAHQRVIAEWMALHANGIVPQAVPAKYRNAIEQ